MSGEGGSPVSEHKHAWKMTLHLDGCHYFQSSYACKCGATASTYDERDVKDDPYSMVWMDDEGVGEPCVRCEELLNGAKPKHEKVIDEPEAVVPR